MKRKKDIRKIIVDDCEYTWFAVGDDDFIKLTIGIVEDGKKRLEYKGQLVVAFLGYHHNVIENFDKDGKVASWSLGQRMSVTSGIARQVIEYALQHGWKPTEKGPMLNLGYMDELLQLKLRRETGYPELKDGQVTVNYATLEGGRTMSRSKGMIKEDDIYFVLDSLEAAKEFARNEVKSDPEVECWIRQGREHAVYYVSALEEKEFSH